MLTAIFGLILLQTEPIEPPTYTDSIRCVTATSVYKLELTGEELARMSRASTAWTAYIRQVWDPQITPVAQLQQDVQAASEEHVLMNVEEPGRLFQVAVHCYNRIVAFAAELQQESNE